MCPTDLMAQLIPEIIYCIYLLGKTILQFWENEHAEILRRNQNQ